MTPINARLGLALLAIPASMLPLAGCQTDAAFSTSDDGPDSAATETAPAETVNRSTDEFFTISDGIRIDHRQWADLGYRWEWGTRPFGKGRVRIDLVNPMGNKLAVQSDDSWTAVVDTATGKADWQVRNTSPLTDFVANARVGSTLISCARPEIYLMDLNTGNLLARQPVKFVVSTPPVIQNGHAVFGTPTGRVICHRFGDSEGRPLPPPLDEGIDVWAYSLDGAITAAPVVVMGTLAGFVTEKGQVFFVDIRSGSGRGTARISGGMDTNPVTDGTHMFVASRDQSIYAFAPESSTYFWRERTADPLTIQPTYHDGVLYCTLAAEGLVAFDVSQNAMDSGTYGSRRWISPDAPGEVIAVQNGDLIVWNTPTLSRVDVNTGDVITSLELKGIESVTTSEFEDGDILAVGNKGQLIRFSAR